MEIKEFVKENGTKKDWQTLWAVYIGFYVVISIELLLSLDRWQDDMITAMGLFLGFGSYTVLFFSLLLNKIRRGIYKRHGIKDYRDEEIAELEERIRRLENDKSRRYD